jgi:hypothetical protein
MAAGAMDAIPSDETQDKQRLSEAEGPSNRLSAGQRLKGRISNREKGLI